MIAAVLRGSFTNLITFMIEPLYTLINSTFWTLLPKRRAGRIGMNDKVRPIE
jgi:hypothetical protein